MSAAADIGGMSQAEQLIEAYLGEAVSEYDILDHWFRRMYALHSFSGKFDGYALTIKASDLMRKRHYINRVRSRVSYEDAPTRINRENFRVEGNEVVIDRYELSPKGIAAARALHT